MATRAVARSRYLDRPYRIVMTRDGRGAQANWMASVEELPGCQAIGATPEEAAAGIQAAMERWVADALEHGQTVPEPISQVIKRGPIEIDVPQSLKVALTEGAVRQSMDLQTFITTVLAGAVGWRPSQTDRDSAWIAKRGNELGRRSDTANSRLLRITAIGNVVLVALVAIAALVLVLVALKHL